MSDEMFFYCQECDHKLSVEQLATLHEGQCPSCSSLAGYSTMPKSHNDGFEQLTMLNDAELLKKMEE